MKTSVTLAKVLFATFALGLQSLVAQPVASFSIAGGTTCVGDSTSFTSTSTGYENIHWYFGDETDTWTLVTPFHRYEAAGTYVVSLVAISGADKDSVSQSVTINPLPDVQLAYSVEPTGGVILIPLGAGVVLSTATPFSAYEWSGGETSNEITAETDGFFWVKATDSNGCSDTAGIEVVVVRGEISLNSNIITPNNDGYNDFLTVDNLGDYEHPVKLVVYNIWNDKVYESNDYLNNWSGSDLDAGSYFYVLSTLGKPDRVGVINILR